MSVVTQHVAPHIDWSSLAPFTALTVGALVVLLAGLLRAQFVRQRIVPLLSIVTLGVTIAFLIARLQHPRSIISEALRIDDLALILDLVFAVSGLAAVVLSLRSTAAAEAGHGEYHSLLLFSILGMAILVSAQNLVTLFIGIELLSIPLYILCASEYRREGSLESGLKYLVIGSVGSATLVYGLALVYGATGSTDFSGIAFAISRGSFAGGIMNDPLLLTGIGLVIVGFAFKASVAPFHQWTPDVYQGAPTPITGFMATATKAAALGAFLRFFDVAVIGEQNSWAPMLAAVATITIIVGNVGALGQSSMKRLLGYSGVAQAGYMLSGVIVGTQLGIEATVLYLMVYLAMNMAAFAVIVSQELDGPNGDDISELSGLGRRRPWLAWPLTISMLALAGIPGTVGFIGKFQLIHALIDGDYTWLAIVLVIGSMISLGYYLRVVATMWMRGPVAAPAAAAAPGELAPIAGGSPEADASDGGGAAGGAAAGGGAAGAGGGAAGGEAPGVSASSGKVVIPTGTVPPSEWPAVSEAIPDPEVAFVAILFAAAAIFFGIFPSPLFDFAAHAGNAISGLF